MMTSEGSILRIPFSKPKWLSRQATSTADDHSPGDEASSINEPPQTQPQTINVVLFGETGVGKSSVINLIARDQIAKVSSDVNGCTMQYQRYHIPFDDMNFAIFDTIGLEEPQMGVNGYLKAIEKAYELIGKLGASGGIHLLLFCMRGGRITATTQSNYRLFCECLCNTKVPIALVFTGLEREVEMEDWWKRNKTHIEHYGIKSDGHACITAVPDDTLEGDEKYSTSQVTIRELLKTCARKGEAFSFESHSLFARFAVRVKVFVSGKRGPRDRDIMKVLTQRCKLDAETAKRIAEMMKKGDTEKSENNEVEGEGEKESGPAKDSTNAGTPPSEPDHPTAVSGIVANDWIEVIDRKEAESAPAQVPSAVQPAPSVALDGRKATEKNRTEQVLPRERSRVDAASGVVPNEGKAARKDVAETLPIQTLGKAGVAAGTVTNGEKEATKRNVAQDSPPQGSNNGNATPNVAPGKEVAKKNVANSSPLPGPHVKATPGDTPNAREEITRDAAEDTSRQEPSKSKSSSTTASRGKEATKKNVAEAALPEVPSNAKAAVSLSHRKEVAKQGVVSGTASILESSNASTVQNGGNDSAKKTVSQMGVAPKPTLKAVPSVGKEGSHPGKSRRESDGSSMVERVKHSRNTLKKQAPESMAALHVGPGLLR